MRRLWDEGLVRSLPDLYRLTQGAAARARRLRRDLGDERDRRDRAVEARAVLARALGLNIPDVGWVTAQNLAATSAPSTGCSDATPGGRQEVDGIGPDRAESIVEWFSDEENRALVAELRGLGLRFEAGEDERPKEGPLTGQTYVITGTLESLSREQARAALEELGAKVGDSVSKKTTGVVVGEEPGNSKLDEGQKTGTPISRRSRPARATGSPREHLREAVLRLAGRPRKRDGCPFWMIAKAKRSSRRSRRATRRSSVVPVFAWTCRSGGLRIRCFERAR